MKVLILSCLFIFSNTYSEANAFVEPPKNLRDQEFLLEKERDPSNETWSTSLRESLELVRASAGFSSDQAIKELKWLIDRKSVAYEIRAEAMLQLRRRVERLSKRKFRSQERYLQKKIRDRQDRPEVLSPAYDTLAAMQRRESFAWNTIASKSVNVFIRLRAAEDYLSFSPNVGKKKEILRTLERVKVSEAQKVLFKEQIDHLRSVYGL